MNKGALVLTLAFGLAGCADDKWDSFVYPDKANLDNFRSAGTYSTLNDCRLGSRAMLLGMDRVFKGDYECGLNCQADPRGPPYICEKTSR